MMQQLLHVAQTQPVEACGITITKHGCVSVQPVFSQAAQRGKAADGSNPS